MRVPSRTVPAGIVCLIALAACSASGTDMLYPDRNVVALAVAPDTTPSFTVGFAPDGLPTANCTVALTARATGRGTATWGDATFYWYTGLDRTKPKDSATVSAADVQTDFENSDISTAAPQHGGWLVSDVLPFDLEIVFHYTVPLSRATKSTRTRVTCGPAVPAAGVAPPAVSQFALTTSRPDWQPGDTLTIEYNAASSSGLWLTVTQVAGAFTAESLFAEQLLPATAHAVRVRAPSTSTLGVSSVAGAFAFDVFGQETSSSASLPPLVDTTPPVLTLTEFAPWTGASTQQIGGTYFVGDSIAIVPWAGDNQGLNAIVWHATPGTWSDSILAYGDSGAGGSSLRIPVHSDWTSNLQFRFYSIDVSGNVSDTVTTTPGAFTVYPTMTRPTVSSVVNGNISSMVLDTAGSTVYLLQDNQWRIAELSLATLQQTGEIALGAYPTSADITPSGDSLLVLVGTGRLLAIDLRQSGATPTSIPLPSTDTTSGITASGVKITANDKAFVILYGGTYTTGQLYEVNLATGAQRARTDAGSGITAIDRTLDDSTLLVYASGCVERYSVATDSFGSCTPTPRSGVLMSADRGGRHLAIQLTTYDSTLAPLLTVQSPIDVSQYLLPTALSADGSYLYYYLFPAGVIRTRTSDGALLDRTIVPGFNPSQMRLSPNGASMVLALDDGVTYRSHIAVIDLRDAGAQPMQLARAPSAVPRLQRSSRRPALATSRGMLPANWAALLHAPPPAPRPWHPGARSGKTVTRAPD